MSKRGNDLGFKESDIVGKIVKYDSISAFHLTTSGRSSLKEKVAGRGKAIKRHSTIFSKDNYKLLNGKIIKK